MAECIDSDCKVAEADDTVQDQQHTSVQWTSHFFPDSTNGDLNVHLKPLSFPETTVDTSSCFIDPDADFPIRCFLCSLILRPEQSTTSRPSPEQCTTSRPSPELVSPQRLKPLPGSTCEGGTALKSVQKPPRAKLTPRDEWLQHLLLEHKIVIHNVQEISSLKCYSDYWRRRLGETPITEVVPVIRTNAPANQSELISVTTTQRTDRPRTVSSEDYYLFSSALPEEKTLRQYLHKKKLEAVLEVQSREREDTSFSRRCLFCSQVLTGNRKSIFQHMLDSHGFNVGQPDNLVFVKNFLDLLQQKLDSLQCLYCERTFRDRVTLKDHMRKKGHKKINAQNKNYDRFYMINYLELGLTWEQVLQRQGHWDSVGVSEESEWLEEPSPLEASVHCLFCLSPHSTIEETLRHMQDSHSFDLTSLASGMGLDYYGQIRMVNYIRRQVHSSACVCCGQHFSSLPLLLDHMTASSHYRLPSNRTVWDQPQYLFPTYENDSLLCGLSDELV